ncbi:MAG TPA: N-acetyl-alpha-D-glucosaminyl L-malate synthase BshA [Phycisphaerae bacterium]|jgi:N-acetyl-alpha-D-glucosaminyl L-malate synthase BshA
MNIAIICYPSVGGSGIVATELAKCLAARGNEVHLISTDAPFRLGEFRAGLSFHHVETPSYPLFREPQYLLSLTNAIVQLSRDLTFDLVHAHYAIPHATAAYLARQILAATPGAHVPKVITTLHGTDITLLGSDRSYSGTVAFSIDQSDGVTAVSESLKADTYRALDLKRSIHVIPNFVDCGRYRRSPIPELRQRMCPPARYDKLIMHMSNFRPVKRAEAVVEVFRRIRAEVRARLLLVGDGPDLANATRLAHDLGIGRDVLALGEQDQVVPLLSVADLFLLPSSQESFGLAALEAMACSVPVIASEVGGLPEVIDDGINGFLKQPDDLDGMADQALILLTTPALHRRVAEEARRKVEQRFCADLVVPQYEAFYRQVTDAV